MNHFLLNNPLARRLIVSAAVAVSLAYVGITHTAALITYVKDRQKTDEEKKDETDQ